jgi:hypothetical protein
MANITIPELQEIAVKCTSDFFNNNIPLNQSLAKEASDRGLNCDQLQRAIEATNTLTYLKSVDSTKDRTSEFPVANYQEIVKLAFVPDSLQKSAPDEGDMNEKVDLVKQAEDALSSVDYSIAQPQRAAHIYKFARMAARALEDSTMELSTKLEKMVKMAKTLKSNPELIQHLSASSASNTEFTKVAGCLGSPGVKRKDYTRGMFKAAQLNEVESFLTEYRESEKLLAQVQSYKESHTKLVEMEKLAFLPALAGLVRAGGIAGAAKASGARGVTGALSYMGARAATRAVVKPVVGAAKALGRSAGSVAGGTLKFGWNSTKNAVASTKIGKELKLPMAFISPRTKANVAGALAVGDAALNVSMYSPPRVDPMNDRSGDVWKALQRR